LNFFWTKRRNSEDKISFRWRSVHVIGVKNPLKDLMRAQDVSQKRGGRGRGRHYIFFKAPIHEIAAINGTVEAQLGGVLNGIDLITKK
jgi:hypothetical protein